MPTEDQKPAPPALKHFIDPGTLLTDDSLHCFEPYLERRSEEHDGAYLQRLTAAGLCKALSSEQCRDIPLFRATLEQARLDEVPVVVVTQPSWKPYTLVPPREEREQAALAALAAARAAQTA